MIEYIPAAEIKEENIVEMSEELINKDMSDINVGELYEDYVSPDNLYGFND